MSPIGQAFAYLSAALAVWLVILWLSLSSYKVDLAEKALEVLECTQNKSVLEEALTNQNSEIEKVRIDYETRIANIKPITLTKVKEVIKVVHIDRNVTEEECNEVFDTIDAITDAHL